MAGLGAEQAGADVKRALLTVDADMRRAYLDLLLARDQLVLLTKLEALWVQSEGLARARYEAGEGAQSDILRAQLELSRIQQRRWALQAEERRRVQTVNRLRAHPLDEPIPTCRSISEMADPPLLPAEEALADAEAQSPELARARLAEQPSAPRAPVAPPLAGRLHCSHGGT